MANIFDQFDEQMPGTTQEEPTGGNIFDQFDFEGAEPEPSSAPIPVPQPEAKKSPLEQVLSSKDDELSILDKITRDRQTRLAGGTVERPEVKPPSFMKPTETLEEAPQVDTRERAMSIMGVQPGEDARSQEAVETLIKNIPGSAKKAKWELVEAFGHPVETAKGVGNLIAGIVQKVIPGEQDKEKYADALWDFYKERYSDPGKTIVEDPVGAALDASAFLTGAGVGLKASGKGAQIATKVTRSGDIVKPSRLGSIAEQLTEAGTKAQRFGEAIDPLAYAFRADLGLSQVLPDGTSTYKKLLKLPESLGVKAIDRIVDNATKYGIPVSRKGLDKVQMVQTELNRWTDQVIKEADEAGKAPTLSPMDYRKKFRSELNKSMKGRVKRTGFDKIAERSLDNIIDTVTGQEGLGAKTRTYENIKKTDPKKAKAYAEEHGLFDDAGVSLSHLQDVKQKIYADNRTIYERQTSGPAFTTTVKASARVARNIIEEIVPEVKGFNRMYGELKEVKKYVDKAVTRYEKAGSGGIKDLVKASTALGIGAMSNPVVGIGSWMGADIMSKPGFKSALALGLNRLNRGGKTLSGKTRQALEKIGVFSPDEYKVLLGNEIVPGIVTGRNFDLASLSDEAMLHTFVPAVDDAYYGLRMDPDANLVSPTTYARQATDGTSAIMRKIENPQAIEAVYNKANIPEIESPNFWELSSLEAGEVGKGSGTKMLRQFTDVADENGRTLVVRPQPHKVKGKVMPKKALVKFYERNGFKLVGKAYGPNTMMIRKPRSVADVKSIPRKGGAIEYVTPNKSRLEGFNLNPEASANFNARYNLGLSPDELENLQILTKVERGKGVTQGIGEGSILFKKALEDANNQGKTVMWIAQSLGGKGLKQSELVRWYERQGAQVVSNADPKRVVMMKRPKGAVEIGPVPDVLAGPIERPARQTLRLKEIKTPTKRGIVYDIRRGLEAGLRRGATDEFRAKNIEEENK